MKILIAADMEGITGVVNWNQVDPDHSEYTRFRRIMTAEVNAAVRGAFEGGASEVVVADGHASGFNLLIEELDDRARLNSGNVAPLGMVQGIASDVKGVIFVGYHARAGTPQGVLDHTWSSAAIAGVWLNDVLVGETGLNAAMCGHYGAPVIMITGDQAVCAEASELLGALEMVVVKHATSRFSAESLPAQLAREIIKGTATRAVQRLSAGDAPAPYCPPAPLDVTLQFAQSDMADKALRLPGVTRLDGRRVAFMAPDMPAAYATFRAAAVLAKA